MGLHRGAAWVGARGAMWNCAGAQRAATHGRCARQRRRAAWHGAGVQRGTVQGHSVRLRNGHNVGVGEGWERVGEG